MEIEQFKVGRRVKVIKILEDSVNDTNYTEHLGNIYQIESISEDDEFPIILKGTELAWATSELQPISNNIKFL